MNDVFASAHAREPIRLSEIAEFSLGDLRVRPPLREVERRGAREQLEPRVMQVLVALATAEGAVVSRDDLIARCWDGRIVGEAAINRCISILREKAETSGAFTIETIPRVGYRLIASAPMVRVAEQTAKEVPPPAAAAMTRALSKVPSVWAAAALVAAIAIALAFYAMRVHPESTPASSAGPVQASIAVLPFKSLSSDKDAGYLADGVQDEVLTRLARIGSLKVISRTSTEEFASHAPNIRDVAKKLGVANVLEGNVQKSGNRIRINVQLIKAASDDHLWAEDYDRDVNDVLSVESDVAGTIARVLAAKMTPHERAEIAAKPTNNPRAYDLYLRGLVFAHKNDAASLETAVQLFQQAVAADPKFALAWAGLARMLLRHLAITVPKGAAHAALAKALSLQPELPEVQAAKGFYLYAGEKNYPAAEREFERVHARWPNNVDALEGLALVLRHLGKWDESRDAFKGLIALDSRVPVHRINLAFNLIWTHDFAGALRVLDDALKIWPDNGWLLFKKAHALQDMGRLDEAAAVLKNVPPVLDYENQYGGFWEQFWLKRQYAKGAAFFRGLLALEQQGENRDAVTFLPRIMIGEYLRMQGDAAGARENYSAALTSAMNLLKAQPDNAFVLVPLPYVYAGLGEGTKGLTLARERFRAARSSNDAVGLSWAEGIYARMMARYGDRAPAIAELTHELSVPSDFTPALLRLDPDFDRLRGDPLFEALAQSDAIKTK